VFLNCSLTSDPIILDNYLSLHFDGSSYTQDENEEPFNYMIEFKNDTNGKPVKMPSFFKPPKDL